ncbi:hypothetical protein AURDEDRAFT_111585 [Auricularia subglabra TFB-10046 SS5]|nr:hypothetical protein AURDEDRAFT_111585 [Auricularia subglabra TFB-10046 SS5]
MTRSATVPYSTSRMTPSPLSQSVTTLQVPDQPRISRKLSKRNSTNRGFRSLFSSRSESEDVGGAQAYAGPSASTASLTTANSRPRPVSIAAAPTQPPTKRMSVLGKLAKKLSLAKHTPEPSMVVARRGATDGSPSARPAAFGVVTPTEPAPHAFPQHPPQPQSPPFSSSNSSSSNGTPPAHPERRTPSPSKARRVPPPELEHVHHLQQEQQQPEGMLHEGARVASPPPITESASEPTMQFPRLVEPPPPPPSEGRSSPDAQYFIGNLMLANPDEYAQTEPSSTPRAAPLSLPPPPPGRFQIESMYSETAATGSTGSLPLLLQVVNPSAPTPNPEEQLEMLRRATPPPLPPAPIPAPEPQRAFSSPVVPTARRPLSAIFSPAAAPPQAPSSAPTTRPASSNTRTDSDKSERRISRKPPPNVSPSMQPRSPASTQSPNGSARSTPTQDPTTLVMAKYASDAAGSPQVERRELLTVNGEEWEVVPVGEAKLDLEVVQVNAPEPEQRRRTSSRATKPERQERESSSRWAKRMEREPSKRSRTLSKPERHVQREPSHTSSRAPSPPPKSVHRYRLERKTSTDVRTPPTSPPESPSKGDRVDRNKSMPAPPTPSKSMRRPVSNLFEPGAPEQLSAHEAYQAERLRKGMSYVGGRDAELPLPPLPSREPSYEARRDTANSLGSGHTAFVMTPPIAPPRSGAF